MTTIKLITSSIVGVGALGGVASGGYYLLKPSDEVKPKNLKEELFKEGIALISTNDEYEVSFKELKDTEAFIDALKTKTASILKTSTLSEGRIALKKWCDENSALNLSEENTRDVLPKIKEYCKKLPLTIEAKLSNKGKQLVTDWKTKLQKLKETSGDGALNDRGLTTDLSSISGTTEEQKLEKWCGDNIKTKINADNDNTIWKKAEKRCVI